MYDFLTPSAAIVNFAGAHPDKIFLRQPINGKLTDFSWSKVEEICRKVAAKLQSLGLEKGDKVAIISKNCAEWVMTDWAIEMAGMVVVPIYPTANIKTIEFAMSHSESKAVFVGKLDNWKAQEPALNPDIPRISFPYPTMACQHQWSDILSEQKPLKDIFDAKPEDLMSILYTSGSTGQAKGVMMTYGGYHYASMANIEQLEMNNEERLLSYLPLAHITERAVILGPAIYAAGTLYFVESLDSFQRDIKRAQPTSFLSVPRLWSKFQSNVHMKIPPKKLRLLLTIPILGAVIAKKIRSELGLNSSKLFGSGTAPISPSILKWYRRLGINISEGWGMSETAGLSCVNYPFVAKSIGTIGCPLPGTKIQLSDQGEIFIKSPGVFAGYYKQPELTEESFNAQGYFGTGDKGVFEGPNNALRITGRVKDLFKTAKGKYVVPVPIEAHLSDNPLIEEVCVMGTGLPQPIAVVVLSELAENMPRAEIRVSLETTLNTVNLLLESHERLQHVVVSKDDWNIENGLLTPTMKVKRNLIEEKYQHLMDMSLQSQVHWE